MLPLACWEASQSTWRIPAASLLMAPPCELALPTLDGVSIEQRFSTDAREVTALAEILVKSGIAAVEDWEKWCPGAVPGEIALETEVVR